MAVQKAMYTGKDNILDAFDTLCNNTPYYSVWISSKDMSFQWNDDDMQKGRQKLDNILDAAEQNEHNDILIIKFHPKKEKLFITDKTPIVGSMAVRVTDLTPGRNRNDGVSGTGSTGGGYLPYDVRRSMELMGELAKSLPDQLKTLNDRLEVLETEGVSGVSQPVTMLEQISGMLGEQGTQMVVGRLLDVLLGAKAPLPSMQVAGIPERSQASTVPPPLVPQNKSLEEQQEEILDNALKRLLNHCDIFEVLPQLADYADKNPETFKMLLLNLKTA